MKTSKQLMDIYGLNHEQSLVVADASKELIVPAGAGSGKTKTLVTKVVHLIEEGKKLEHFLVLTFTKKAASEMKERMKKELTLKGLVDVANKIDSANISTFDAFAYNFVKQNASLIGLDSHIELLDGSVFQTLKIEMMHEIIINIMKNEHQDKKLYEFIERYTEKTSEEKLILSLLQIYQKLESQKPMSTINIDELVKTNSFIDIHMLENKIYDISSEFVETYQDLFDELKTYFAYLSNKHQEVECPKLPRFKWKSLNIEKTQKDMISNLLKPVKDLLKHNIRQIDVDLYIKEESKVIQQIFKILTSYEEALENFKKETHKYEFQDIAGFLNQILKTHPDLLERQKEKFLYVFVDEYQDTSKVQSDFLNMLIKDNQKINVLYVGDIKQSIYKFRDAKPETFIHKLKTIKSIGLTTNYRSSKEVITFINQLFTHILDDKDKYDIDYRDNHHMLSGSTKFNDDPSAQVYLLEVFKPEEDKRRAYDPVEEAFVVGHKIIDLLKEHKIKAYNEVAILARNVAHFPIIKDVFDVLGIPIQIQIDQQLKQTYMLKLIANILKLSQMIYLQDKNHFNQKRFYYFSIARSELFEQSDYKLFKSLIQPNQAYDKTLVMDEQIVKKCRIIYDAILTKTNRQIIDLVIDEFDIYHHISKANKIQEKIYQIDYLFNLSTSLSDLHIVSHDFVDYIYQMAYDESKQYKISVLQDKDENSVKVTNIHQSKGLEYNTLFVVGLNKNFRKPKLSELSYHEVTGINFPLKVEDNSQLLALNTFINKMKQYHMINENIKEELRLLYVAFTRAEKALYIVTTPKDDYIKLESFTDFLYENGLRNLIKNDHITTYNRLTKDPMYYQYLKEHALYYPKMIEQLEEANLNLNHEFVEKKKASITLNEIIDSKTKRNIEKGLEMHLDFEYQNMDNPFVKKFYETKFDQKNLKDAKLIFEYEFSYETNEQVIHGIIDLVAMYKDEIHIIDYKLKHADINTYKNQLLTYEKYLNRIFSKKIKMFLYSIVDQQLIKVDH